MEDLDSRRVIPRAGGEPARSISSAGSSRPDAGPTFCAPAKSEIRARPGCLGPIRRQPRPTSPVARRPISALLHPCGGYRHPYPCWGLSLLARARRRTSPLVIPSPTIPRRRLGRSPHPSPCADSRAPEFRAPGYRIDLATQSPGPPTSPGLRRGRSRCPRRGIGSSPPAPPHPACC
jgi:hypothetical protein